MRQAGTTPAESPKRGLTDAEFLALGGKVQGLTDEQFLAAGGKPAASEVQKPKKPLQPIEAIAGTPTAASGLRELAIGALEPFALQNAPGVARSGLELIKNALTGDVSGLAPAAASIVAAPIKAPLDYIMALAHGDPDAAANAAGGIISQTLPALAGVGAAGKAAAGQLPSTARAGVNFQKVMAAARDVPIDITATGPAIEEAVALGKSGSKPPPVIKDFIKRTEPMKAKFGGVKVQMAADPMTYEEGRRFAVKAGELTAQEKRVTSRPMKRQVTQFAEAMKTANRDAAVKVGMGDLYDAAMKEYRQARNLEEAADVLKKWAPRVIIRTLELGALGGIGYELWKSH